MSTKQVILDVISWAHPRSTKKFYHTGAKIQESINKQITELKALIQRDKNALAVAIAQEVEPEDPEADGPVWADNTAGLLVALQGSSWSPRLRVIKGTARAISDRLEEMNRLSKLSKNIIKEAKYELDEDQLKEFGL